MKTKVDIISGFLGAGKTTLIKKLIEEKLYNEKLLIIENEFGETGVDGTVLKQASIEVKEIKSGCICCTLAGDFEKAISEVLAEYKPDRIIIEPSGVGKLSDVIKACQAARLRDIIEINMVMTVVDVMRYRIFIANFGEFFENQIKHAKIIILSRTQNIDNGKLESIVKDIHKINEKASVITTPWESLNSGMIISAAEQDEDFALASQTMGTVGAEVYHNACVCDCCEQSHNHSHLHSHYHSAHHSHSADEVFEVWGAETPRVFSEDEISSIFKMLDNDKPAGYILRGKGILQTDKEGWLQFDYVPGEISIKSSNPDYTGRICIIGTGLDRNVLNNLFGLT